MSVSFPDCFSDLLCDEDSGTILSQEYSPGCSSDVDSLPIAAPEDGLLVNELIRGEEDFVPGIDYFSRLRGGTHHHQSVLVSAREKSVAWILKVHASYRFHPLTAYLSVNYMDRFLYSRCLPEWDDGWPMQLLSVACLSLAAKMEEPLLPSLLDLQVEGAPKYVFEPRTIRRMELLVLTVLHWRLRSITPFSFSCFFAYKVDPTGTFVAFLISRSSEIILSNIQNFGFLKYRPSCIAAAAMLCAASTIPGLSLRNPGDAESWCGGLIKEEITSCYRLMEETLVKNKRRKAPKVVPQFRITTRGGTRYWRDYYSSPSSTNSDPQNKRRRLNESSWVDNDKGIYKTEHEEKE